MRSILIITAIILCSCGGASTDELKAQLRKDKAVFESVAQSLFRFTPIMTRVCVNPLIGGLTVRRKVENGKAGTIR
jgi:hypothetical protein